LLTGVLPLRPLGNQAFALGLADEFTHGTFDTLANDLSGFLPKLCCVGGRRLGMRPGIGCIQMVERRVRRRVCDHASVGELLSYLV
jgi:hypothetical protein